MRSPRNRTLTLTEAEREKYLERVLTLSAPASLDEVENRVLCGDTFAILPFLPEKFADLIIVDPPYNMDKDFGGGKFRKMDAENYARYTEKYLELLMPLLKDNGSLYLCCDWESSIIIAPVLQKFLTIRNRITWQREKGRGALRNWKNGMEDIWFATKSASFTFNAEAVKIRRKVLAPYREGGKPKDWEATSQGNFRNTFASNFWDDISIPYWSMPENTPHPTQKPEKLLAKLILASSNAGEMIFDPFAGSGSTLSTAAKLERRYCGIEQNELYCLWAEKRLENALSDRSIQGYTDGVFWERNTSIQQKKLR